VVSVDHPPLPGWYRPSPHTHRVQPARRHRPGARRTECAGFARASPGLCGPHWPPATTSGHPRRRRVEHHAGRRLIKAAWCSARHCQDRGWPQRDGLQRPGPDPKARSPAVVVKSPGAMAVSLRTAFSGTLMRGGADRLGELSLDQRGRPFHVRRHAGEARRPHLRPSTSPDLEASISSRATRRAISSISLSVGLSRRCP